MQRLKEHFQIQRRYMRSANLERDADSANGLEGYVLTPRALASLRRILESFGTPNATRAWTLTGVYGTGKSAFANFLSAMFADSESRIYRSAQKLLKTQPQGKELAKQFNAAVPKDGIVRAFVTARREPLTHTLIRAIGRGAAEFWSKRRGRKPKAVERAIKLREDLLAGEMPVSVVDLPELIQDISQASGSGLLLIIDELGKLLEHAGRTAGAQDLFVLQQLAELPAGPEDAPVLVVGLLHQAFYDYGHLLSSAERKEWEKVQGRFEDIPFADAPDQLLRLMAEAIQANVPDRWRQILRVKSREWYDELAGATEGGYIKEVLSPDRIMEVYPIHPVAALTLPGLCTRYGQNDRSLFTFLASNEPHAFGTFLEENVFDESNPPLLKLATVYDYFVDSASIGTTGSMQLHRWAEIHGSIRETAGLMPDAMEVLKTIGTLNLLSSTGPLRARRDLVIDALSSSPGDKAQRNHWGQVLDDLVEQRIITYRQQVDEYRIWQGSDFDIDAALEVRIQSERRPLSAMLKEVAPLAPVVAQRHSYNSGTLRFFECRYADSTKDLASIETQLNASAGCVAYWVGDRPITAAPPTTADGKPLAVIGIQPTTALKSAANELSGLQQIRRSEPALQTDGVARREVRQRLDQAREVLDDVLREALERAYSNPNWFGGHTHIARNFNAVLSDLCDEAYSQGPVLWNEIINRRELTSQGARAQRELIAGLLTKHHVANLGIEGTGPEFSIYASLLQSTGIHREMDGEWAVVPPSDRGVEGIWDAVERFCINATAKPRPISELFTMLRLPPYGATDGIIPIFLAAVLLYHEDDVTLYQDGTFLPTLTPPQFELLVKYPDRFAVKYFELAGVRWELFKEIEAVIKAGGGKRPVGVRNATLLTVVRPLVQFAVALPPVTKQDRHLSARSRNVLDALLAGREPDELIFTALPRALGLEPFGDDDKSDGRRHERFRHDLFATLRELQQHYDLLLEGCRTQIHEAFGMRADVEHVREDLRVRASYMLGRVIDRRMKSFMVAAVDEERQDREWLESLIMVIADRPANSWTPENRAAFELNLGDFARRFKNLEALQKEGVQEGMEGFEARRVTITEPRGTEVHRLVWVNRQDQKRIRMRAAKLIEELGDIADDHLRQAIILNVVEQVLEARQSNEKVDIQPTKRSSTARKQKHA